ncbi:probable mitochondrial glutathione transporter SLC25A40 [Anthonomus grandis grandis]|uniref:probable mitochondrial glutathione transporter SLC25A40 n=1 Tax=Anthonomus grandis grandis TaxID=2921223 RepID=UPI002165DA7B|nr:probable mitochondrial glutathione transporter SLC25A40 [Anthonomus grandis grandis]
MTDNMEEPQVIDYDDPKYRITPGQQAAASCTGALLTSLIMTPLDVIKIRLQSQQQVPTNCYLYCSSLMDHICSCQPTDPRNPWYKTPPTQFNGTLDAFVQIGRSEGIGSLWSGLSPTLVLAIPATICYFVTYEQLRIRLKSWYNSGKMFGEGAKQPYWIPLVSGATARVVSVTLVSPLELIRTKMQSQKLSNLELREALKNLVRTDGVKGLWRGITPTLLRDVPFSAIYWMSYEATKEFMGAKNPTLMQTFIAGAVSGSIAATITVPFDVVKTHQQIEFGSALLNDKDTNGTKRARYRTTREVIRGIYRQQGIGGLYKGLAPRLIKVAPACAIMISSFEYGKVFFNRLAQQQQQQHKEENGLTSVMGKFMENEAKHA